jgi:hydroxypyruvate isomerase
MAGAKWIFAQTMKHSAATVCEPGLKGRLNHSVCRWCYKDISLDVLCKAAVEIGLQSVEILKMDDLTTLKKYGLTCAMISGVPGDITDGLNRKKITMPSQHFSGTPFRWRRRRGFPNVICFPGNRQGMSDEQGLDNCVAGIKRFIAVAEKNNVNVCMELLNSKEDHPDYMCDHTAWGVELYQRVGSKNFKRLYDIYHMQIMEGNIIQTIQDNHQYIGLYHTGGVPGRHEIDESQELHYPAIMKAIMETGFKDMWLRNLSRTLQTARFIEKVCPTL